VTHVLKSGGWREGAVQVALDLLYVSAGVLVLADFLQPDLRLGRIGSCMLLVAVGISTKQQINRKLSRAWEAGRRSEQRHAELEGKSEPQLAVVKDMVRPR